MSKLVPIRGKFESARALLGSIMEDEIQAFVIFTLDKDNNPMRAQFQMSRANLTFAGTSITNWAFEDD